MHLNNFIQLFRLFLLLVHYQFATNHNTKMQTSSVTEQTLISTNNIWLSSFEAPTWTSGVTANPWQCILFGLIFFLQTRFFSTANRNRSCQRQTQWRKLLKMAQLTVKQQTPFPMSWHSLTLCLLETVEFVKLIKDLKAKIIDMKNQLKPLKQK